MDHPDDAKVLLGPDTQLELLDCHIGFSCVYCRIPQHAPLNLPRYFDTGTTNWVPKASHGRGLKSKAPGFADAWLLSSQGYCGIELIRALAKLLGVFMVFAW